jgi:hypothetical protein
VAPREAKAPNRGDDPGPPLDRSLFFRASQDRPSVRGTQPKPLRGMPRSSAQLLCVRFALGARQDRPSLLSLQQSFFGEWSDQRSRRSSFRAAPGRPIVPLQMRFAVRAAMDRPTAIGSLSVVLRPSFQTTSASSAHHNICQKRALSGRKMSSRGRRVGRVRTVRRSCRRSAATAPNRLYRPILLIPS